MATDDRIDALFAGPAEEFVAARDALVKQLKAEGQKDVAAEVKALRRPTVAAWAVNQVARTAKKDVARLVQVGDRLRDAHEALLEGKGDGAIREVTVERRKLVAELTKQAVALLGAGGDAQAEAITHTFDAAVADPESAMAVREGRLSKELEAPSGFGGGLVFGSSRPAGPRTRTDERRAVRSAVRSTARADAAASEDDREADVVASPAAEARRSGAAEAAAKEAERRRRDLRREAEERSAEAEQAAGEAAAARQEVSRLEDALVIAIAKAEAAAESAELAHRRASTAQRALDEVPDAE